MFTQIHLGDPDGELTMEICRKPGRSGENEHPHVLFLLCKAADPVDVAFLPRGQRKGTGIGEPGAVT